MPIPFGNSFAVVLRDMRTADDRAELTTAIATAQLKTAAGVNIGSAVSFAHNGGGDYRAEFAASIFDDTPAELAVDEMVTIEIVGSSPNFRFDIVERVESRG